MATWNKLLKEWEFKQGEDAWFVADYSRSGLLVVRVKILKVDTSFLKAYGELRYWIDEPSDYALGGENFFATKDAAMVELERRIDLNNQKVIDSHEGRDVSIDYQEYVRPNLQMNRDVVESKMRTYFYEQNPRSKKYVANKTYPYKVKDVDWFISDTKVRVY